MTKIITLTLSPAVDVEYLVTEIEPEKTNRSRQLTVKCGGKGINVSRCIKKLSERDGRDIGNGGLTTVAVTGGETGKLLKRMAERENLRLKTVNIQGETRINTSVIPDEGRSVEVNSPSPPIGEAGNRIIRTIGDILKKERTAGNDCVVVMAGSLPSDVGADYYARMICTVKDLGGITVLDCDGEAMRVALASSGKPDFIKPNIHELSGIAGRSLETADEASESAISLGDICVLTTMGEKGVLVTCGKGKSRKSTYVPGCPEKVKRLKGAGDTFLGAFIYNYFIVTNRKNIISSVKYANRISAEFVSGRLSLD